MCNTIFLLANEHRLKMKSYQITMIKERAALDNKISALDTYQKSKEYMLLKQHAKDLIDEQHKLMVCLSGVYTKRIDDFSKSW